MALGPLIIDIEGQSLTAEDRDILQHPAVGGIIFFTRNYESPEQISELVRQIREVKDCLITVDQEGGLVQRFKKGFTALPPLADLGKLVDASTPMNQVFEYAHMLGKLMAMEITSVGIDLSFAPVLDLNKGVSEVIKSRAFHSDPKMVSELAYHYMQGMSSQSMARTAKHFPGHGSIKADSHFDLPVDKRPLNELLIDLAPFRFAVRHHLEAVMPAHVIYERVDPLPAGFSKYWLNQVLRKDLGFDGVIISDDLTMKATESFGDMPSRCEQALHAGCDLILICNDREKVAQVLDSQIELPAKSKEIQKLKKSTFPIAYKELASNAQYKACQEILGQFNEKIQLLPSVA